jgi:hypothetical protein
MVLPRDIKDGKKYYIENSNNAYFAVYDYDIRFYDKRRTQFFCINTYPVKPNEFLKQVNHFVGCF